MSTERILENTHLQKLRETNVITSDEVAIQAGDLYFAKNVLTNEKRMISIPTDVFTSNESTTRPTGSQLLKG
jgi:hypothetical protein